MTAGELDLVRATATEVSALIKAGSITVEEYIKRLLAWIKVGVVVLSPHVWICSSALHACVKSCQLTLNSILAWTDLPCPQD